MDTFNYHVYHKMYNNIIVNATHMTHPIKHNFNNSTLDEIIASKFLILFFNPSS